MFEKWQSERRSHKIAETGLRAIEIGKGNNNANFYKIRNQRTKIIMGGCMMPVTHEEHSNFAITVMFLIKNALLDWVYRRF